MDYKKLFESGLKANAELTKTNAHLVETIQSLMEKNQNSSKNPPCKCVNLPNVKLPNIKSMNLENTEAKQKVSWIEADESMQFSAV
jgi:hypothetical protein